MIDPNPDLREELTVLDFVLGVIGGGVLLFSLSAVAAAYLWVRFA